MLREVLLGMLQQAAPDLKTNHVRIEPVQPASKERVCGSFWKARTKAKPGAQELRRRLIRDVATALIRERVVFFHIDADDVWARRERCENACEHWPRFQRDVWAVVHGSARGASLTERELDDALVVAMPFWEVESWAFANTTLLREILSDAKDLAALERWAHDLHELDEIPDIKDELSICDSRTHELVQRKRGFPAGKLIAASKSYAAVVERLRGSKRVARGLAEAASRPF